MARLERLAPSEQFRRGSYLKEFLTDEACRRRQGERIAEWISRWEEGAERLRNDGVDLTGIPDLLGWYFLDHAHLSEDRVELIRSSLQADQIFDLGQLKAAMLRLFARP